MAACNDADNDWIACNAKSNACDWYISTARETTSCTPHTCASKALGSTCFPVLNFDLESYTICGPAVTGGCTEVEGNILSADTCQLYTLKTYTWD